MKIIVCTNFFDTISNGTAQFPHQMLKLEKHFPNQHEVVILGDDIKVETAKHIYVPFKFPRPVHAFYAVLRNWDYYRALKKYLKTHDADVIVFNDAKSGVFSRWFLPKKIKIIGRIHNDNCLIINRNNYKKKRHYYLEYVKRFFENRAIERFDALVGETNHICQLVNHKAAMEQNVAYLPPSLNFSLLVFSPQRSSFNNRTIKILFVKLNYIRGGLLDLFEAIELLPTFSFQLSVIGPPHSEYASIKKCAEKCVNLTLNFEGSRPQQAVFEAMNKHDILCIPSRAEAGGITNIEGLKQGISVVSTNAGGIPEILDYGKNGWLAEPNNPKSLAEALKNCIETDEEERLKIKIRGKEFVETHFSDHVFFDKFLQICQKIGVENFKNTEGVVS